jgi:hypothetical protein
MKFPDGNKRLYQCFVCGEVFKSYPEMSNHVIENHEEGREYIICPVKHCANPVRDMRFHFKTKHPALKCPQNCQLRAIVMYDIQGSKRKKLPNFKEGFIISEKNNGKKMHYRSGWEEAVYNCLEKLGDVLSYEVEPFPIPYYHRGKSHRYFPDLRVHYANGAVEVWEIKPRVQKVLPQNSAKFKAATHFCQTRGWTFEIITENEIASLKKKAGYEEKKRLDD